LSQRLPPAAKLDVSRPFFLEGPVALSALACDKRAIQAGVDESLDECPLPVRARQAQASPLVIGKIGGVGPFPEFHLDSLCEGIGTGKEMCAPELEFTCVLLRPCDMHARS